MKNDPDVIFVRVYHSPEEEFGHLSKFGCVEISNGICWLAAAVRARGYSADIIDALPLRMKNDELARNIAERRPKYVGISACTMDIEAGSDLSKRLKSIDKDIVTIVGGPHVTAIPEDAMRQFRDFDIAVIGEGEETICDLLDSLEGRSGRKINEIDGIIYRDKDSVVRTAGRKHIKDLDSLPLPAWDLLPDLKKFYFAPPWTMHSGNTATIITSRGCPFRCIYCDRKVFGNVVRSHSADYVMKMIKVLYDDYGVRHLRISDDNFMTDRKRLLRICQLIQKEDLGISWSCLARVDSIDADILREMKKAGCWSIAFGVETGSQKIHDIEKKGVKLEQVARGVKLTREAGIKTISFNIIGHPLETVDTIKETINFNKRIGVDDFKTQFMTPFPGTELYNDVDKYGKLDKDWKRMAVFGEPVFVPHGLTKEDMIEWNKRGFRSFYFQPRIIFSYLMGIRSFDEFKTILIGGITLIAWGIAGIFCRKGERCGDERKI